jgi:hypothetical protein
MGLEATTSLCCVSWIDEKPLPKVGFWFVAGAAISWPKRVVMGLVGTANPEPPIKLIDVDAFRGLRQYRALLACEVARPPRPIARASIIDAGYTPPFDKSKLDTRLAALAPIPDDPKFYAGESSQLSAIVAGKLHPCSTLKVGAAEHVLVSAFIKFRAGAHTDAIGINDANSPVHVPWVWSEYALVASGSRYRLLAQGSHFPSHAWYVGGKQVAKCYQRPIAVSDKEPAISAGSPANLPAFPASTDRSDGPASRHDHTLGQGTAFSIDVTSLVA